MGVLSYQFSRLIVATYGWSVYAYSPADKPAATGSLLPDFARQKVQESAEDWLFCSAMFW